MEDNIFSKMTEKERTLAWIYMIFNKDKIIEKTEQWTKEAEKAGMTLTEYLESISPLNDKKKLSWLGKNCKDCGNEKCKKLGTLSKGMIVHYGRQKARSRNEWILYSKHISRLSSWRVQVFRWHTR